MSDLAAFEPLVLAAIRDLGADAYGVSIHARVAERALPRRAGLGAVYAALNRLEDRRLILSFLSGPTPERGGRAKRHYRLEHAGVRALGAITQNRGEMSWYPDWKPVRLF